MRKRYTVAVAIALAVTAGGCNKLRGKSAEATLAKGQVVATVNGEDITLYELNTELQGARVPTDPEGRKRVEQAALQQIVSRKILAKIARDRGMDKSPAYLLQERRADDLILTQLLQRQIAAKVSNPTKADAEKFVADNPGLFAQHKIMLIDQIAFPPPSDVNKLKAFEPLKTLDAIQQKLGEDGIQFRRAPNSFDTLSINPAILAKIEALPAGEVFVMPANGAVTANVITGSRIEPITGDPANNIALNILRNRSVSAAAEKEIAPLVKNARDSVKYQPGYAPPAAPAGAPAPAPAPTAP